MARRRGRREGGRKKRTKKRVERTKLGILGKRERKRERGCAVSRTRDHHRGRIGWWRANSASSSGNAPQDSRNSALLNYASIRLARGRSRKNPFAALSRYTMEIGRNARACVRACVRHRDPGRTTDRKRPCNRPGSG